MFDGLATMLCPAEAVLDTSRHKGVVREVTNVEVAAIGATAGNVYDMQNEAQVLVTRVVDAFHSENKTAAAVANPIVVHNVEVSSRANAAAAEGDAAASLDSSRLRPVADDSSASKYGPVAVSPLSPKKFIKSQQVPRMHLSWNGQLLGSQQHHRRKNRSLVATTKFRKCLYPNLCDNRGAASCSSTA